jgi:hypothetical protein
VFVDPVLFLTINRIPVPLHWLDSNTTFLPPPSLQVDSSNANITWREGWHYFFLSVLIVSYIVSLKQCRELYMLTKDGDEEGFIFCIKGIVSRDFDGVFNDFIV